MRGRRTHGGIVWTLGAIACGGAEGGGLVTRTDSAGIAIVMNTGPDRPLAWTFERRLTLGGKESGPEAFDQLARGVVDADAAGQIYVIDYRGRRLVVFDTAGVHLWSVGREGSGPGEFRFPVAVVAADTVVEVFDPGNARVEQFRPRDGARLGSERVGPVFMSRFTRATAGLVSDLRTFGDDGRHDLNIIRGTDTLRLASLAAPTRRVTFPRCPIMIALPPLFQPEIAFDARGGRIVVAGGVPYEVQIFEGDRLAAVWRRDLAPVPATTVLAAVEVAERGPRRLSAGGTVCDLDTEEMAEARGYVELVPAVRELVLRPDGGVWIRRGPRADGTSVTDVFAPDGTYSGTLPPDAPWPLAFLPDGSVLAEERDEVDVDRLVLYAVSSGGD